MHQGFRNPVGVSMLRDKRVDGGTVRRSSRYGTAQQSTAQNETRNHESPLLGSILGQSLQQRANLGV